MNLKTVTDICTAIGAIATAITLGFIASQATDSRRQLQISILQSNNDLIAKRIDLENFIEKLVTAKLKLNQWLILLDKTTDNNMSAFLRRSCDTSGHPLCATNGIESALDNVLNRESPESNELKEQGRNFLSDASTLLQLEEPSVSIAASISLVGDMSAALDICTSFVPEGPESQQSEQASAERWERMQLAQKLALKLTDIRDNGFQSEGILRSSTSKPPLSEFLQNMGPPINRLKASLVALRNMHEAHHGEGAPTDANAVRWAIKKLSDGLNEQVAACDKWLRVAVSQDQKLRRLPDEP